MQEKRKKKLKLKSMISLYFKSLNSSMAFSSKFLYVGLKSSSFMTVSNNFRMMIQNKYQ